MNANILQHRFINIPFSAILASFLLHLIIPLFLITAKVLDHFGLSLFPEKKIIHDAYQSFIQVDVVALPDQLINEKVQFDPLLPAVEAPKQAEAETKAEDKEDTMTVAEEKAEAERKEKEAKAKEKAAEKQRLAEKEKALKKLADEAKREQALKALQAKSGKTGRSKLSGNILSQGTSTKGIIGNAKERYTAVLIEAIKQHFNIYLWQQKKGLLADVQIELFPTGRVRRKRVIKPSSDPLYDSAILKAIDDAQPLPLPDDPSLVNEEIHITFKP